MIAHQKLPGGSFRAIDLEEMREVALRTNPTFLLNVALQHPQGDHRGIRGRDASRSCRGCAFVKEHAMVGVEAPYDIVITTNSGYPLDQNLYQSVKGMSAASQVVKQGGAIIIAAACEDGLPAHGRYAELLAQAGFGSGDHRPESPGPALRRMTSGRCRFRPRSSSRRRCMSIAMA